jgi:hypothetical protein
MSARHVASTPVEVYWLLPIGAFLYASPMPLDSRLSLLREERGPRHQADFKRFLEERERTKRCHEVTSQQRIEFENQFLLALYWETAGDTSPTRLGQVWLRLNHECAPELTAHTLRVWRERRCLAMSRIPTSYGQLNLTAEDSKLSLTAAGRDLCIRATVLDSMQQALDERSEGPTVKNEYYFRDAQVVGTGAHVHDTELIQFVNTADQVKLDKLAEELAKLGAELARRSTSAEERVAVGSVSAAELAARAGDQQDVWRQLAKAGRWALDVAKEVGVSVAVEAITAVFKYYNIPIS